jgi:hypothetical protein
MGARHSSGFKNTMNQAGADFAEALQGNRLGLQSNAIQQMMQMAQMLLGQRPYEQFLFDKKKKNSWLGGALPFIGAAAGGGLGFMGGGPAGALAGAKLGGGLGAAGSKAFF